MPGATRERGESRKRALPRLHAPADSAKQEGSPGEPEPRGLKSPPDRSNSSLLLIYEPLSLPTSKTGGKTTVCPANLFFGPKHRPSRVTTGLKAVVPHVDRAKRRHCMGRIGQAVTGAGGRQIIEHDAMTAFSGVSTHYMRLCAPISATISLFLISK